MPTRALAWLLAELQFPYAKLQPASLNPGEKMPPSGLLPSSSPCHRPAPRRGLTGVGHRETASLASCRHDSLELELIHNHKYLLGPRCRGLPSTDKNKLPAQDSSVCPKPLCPSSGGAGRHLQAWPHCSLRAAGQRRDTVPFSQMRTFLPSAIAAGPRSAQLIMLFHQI